MELKNKLEGCLIGEGSEKKGGDDLQSFQEQMMVTQIELTLDLIGRVLEMFDAYEKNEESNTFDKDVTEV